MTKHFILRRVCLIAVFSCVLALTACSEKQSPFPEKAVDLTEQICTELELGNLEKVKSLRLQMESLVAAAANNDIDLGDDSVYTDQQRNRLKRAQEIITSNQ